MLSRIAKHQICKGMFVEAVECPSNEFSRRRFVLNDDEMLTEILSTSAEFVLINLSGRISPRGASDVANSRSRTSQSEASGTRREKEMLRAVSAAADKASGLFATLQRRTLPAEELYSVADEVADLLSSAPDVFLKVTRLKTKDVGTYVHSLAVSALMNRVALISGCDATRAKELGLAGLLHDIGKLAIPGAIINKSTKLTPVELSTIRSHPAKGRALLRRHTDVSKLVLDICQSHHELLDGSGYPQGLAGSQISPEVRIATACDVFDALTSPRAYKKEWKVSDAVKWMSERPHLFDMRYVVRVASIFPE